MTADIAWRTLPISSKELSLSRVLRCGQAFRWKNINSVWSFSTQDQIILLKQDDRNLHYACILAERSKMKNPYEKTLQFVTDYFNLDVKLADLYEQWAQVENKYRSKSKATSFAAFPGIRMLRQDPWETVVLFICSSNNNVKRISKMCDLLCQEYGTYINDHDGVPYYSFPQPELLAKPEVEQRLRELGFGYRARYIQQTANMFVSDEYPHLSLDSLWELRSKSSEEAHEYLLELCGVGPKVADCISLMALDNHDVVPVDTHVLQIAVRDYKFKGPKTMNKIAYSQVKQHLRDLFGDYAGWAQLVMFAADLSDLNNGLNEVDGQKIKHEVAELVKEEIEVETGGVEVKLETIEVKQLVKTAVTGTKRKINTAMKVKKIKTEA